MNEPFITIPILLTIISAFLVFSLGFLSFWKNKNSSLNRVFFLYSIFTTIWLIGNYKLLVSCSSPGQALFWDRFIYAGVVFIPSAVYHFVNIFTRSKTKIIVVLFYLLSVVFLITSRTNLFVNDLFVYKWGCHGKAAIFHHLFLGMFAISLFSIFFQILSYLKKTEDKVEKMQAKYIFFSFLVLATIGSLGFLPAYQIGVFPISYLAGAFTVIILSYAVFKHHLLNIQVIATELFTFALWMFILIRTIIAQSQEERLSNAILLVATIIIGIFLIRGIWKEVRMREEKEKLAGDLEKANTQLGEVNVQLEEKNEKLKELDKAKSEFVSIASHQLRTPITAVKGYSSMLLEGTYGAIPEKAKKALERIFESSNRLVHMITDFLTLSRIERGKLEYVFQKTDFKKMVSSEMDELKTVNKREKKGLDMSLDIAESEDYTLNLDQEKIRQVIYNIIENAMKYTPKGFVKVSLRKTPDKRRVVLKVQDSGIGLRRESLEKLFEKFSQAGGNNHAGAIIGIGLGLYVAKEIIQAHRGEIRAESRGEGKGSTFYVELPVGFVSPENNHKA